MAGPVLFGPSPPPTTAASPFSPRGIITDKQIKKDDNQKLLIIN